MGTQVGSYGQMIEDAITPKIISKIIIPSYVGISDTI